MVWKDQSTAIEVEDFQRFKKKRKEPIIKAYHGFYQLINDYIKNIIYKRYTLYYYFQLMH